MGLSDNGNDPVTLLQTRCSCARGQGADQDIVTCVVPGGAGFAAQFNLVGVCPTRQVLCAPLRAPTAPVPSAGCKPKRAARMTCARIAPGRAICAEPGQPDELVLGSG